MFTIRQLKYVILNAFLKDFKKILLFDQVLKQFFNDTYKHEHSSYMSDSTWTGLWSLTNGLMPLGGMIGGLASGL